MFSSTTITIYAISDKTSHTRDLGLITIISLDKHHKSIYACAYCDKVLGLIMSYNCFYSFNLHNGQTIPFNDLISMHSNM